MDTTHLRGLERVALLEVNLDDAQLSGLHRRSWEKTIANIAGFVEGLPDLKTLYIVTNTYSEDSYRPKAQETYTTVLGEYYIGVANHRAHPDPLPHPLLLL